ncbi:hypothetical protein CAPTEDRAFT_188485 [Capitella teleta]|uniref:Methyltransferase type 11 domain-containing protein n=1 Tax=Capitella teleta TaxID=283909 RepID=R7TPQ7_CAPTE|nr:hypothetical protein CAPTEDRAFT_188485 [Capitella teleta]|eukprot:ELT95644.1 hypothetical protein CAPTEDRAFT_188485 [Capitella teleta]
MAARLGNTASKNILETAAGTGSGSLILQQGLEPGTRFTVSDISNDMLAMAREKLGKTADIQFDLADACALPYDDDHFDSVVSLFGLMYCEDKPAALREAQRVLKPGGKFLFCVWDRLEKNILSYNFYHKAARYFDGELPRFHKLPHNCASLDFLKTELELANFEAINITVVKKLAAECSARDAASSFITGTPFFYELQEKGIDHNKVIREMAEDLKEIFGENLKGLPRQALFVEASKY